MNWKEISENWKKFTEERGLKDESKVTNYFYGKQEVYQAQEVFQGFHIFFRNKLNKPASFTAFSHKANSFSITTPVFTDSSWTLKISPNSFFKKLFMSSGKLSIETTLQNIENLVPLKSIESISKDFNDLVIRVTKNEKKQNKETIAETAEIEILTKTQPQNLNELNGFRNLIHGILIKLEKEGKIKPAHNNA